VASLTELVAWMDDLLEAPSFEDYGPNGLQVAGSGDVGRIVTGVSAQTELFERAAALGADLVLCHHGLFWGSGARGIDQRLKRRLDPLFRHDMSLVAYHLPLDAHPEIGNNALLCAGLGLKRGESFAPYEGRDIGWVGHAPDPLSLAELIQRSSQLLERVPLVFDGGPDPMCSVGIVSGGAAESIYHAADLGLDAFLTGEPKEFVMAAARESGVSFLAAGHYATETFGVRRLGELLAERFSLEHSFVDIPNPV